MELEIYSVKLKTVNAHVIIISVENSVKNVLIHIMVFRNATVITLFLCSVGIGVNLHYLQLVNVIQLVRCQRLVIKKVETALVRIILQDSNAMSVMMDSMRTRRARVSCLLLSHFKMFAFFLLVLWATFTFQLLFGS